MCPWPVMPGISSELCSFSAMWSLGWYCLFLLLFSKGTSAGWLYRKFSSLGPRFLGTTRSLFALQSLKLTSKRTEVLSLVPGVDGRQFTAKRVHLKPCLKLWRQLVSMFLHLLGWEPVECGWLWTILIEIPCWQQVIECLHLYMVGMEWASWSIPKSSQDALVKFSVREWSWSWWWPLKAV